MKRLTAIVFILFLTACGKKGDPSPPVPIIPKTTTDLSLAQRGPNILLTWSYPSLTTAGKTLSRIESIAVYRYREVLPGSLAGRDPRQLTPGETVAGAPPEVELFEKMPAVTPRQFSRVANRIDSISAENLPAFVAGAEIIYTDAPEIRAEDGLPVRYTYAVVTVGEEGRSEFSNLASIVPLQVPVPPGSMTGSAPGTEVVLTWAAPEASITGGTSPTVVGYNVYRFPATGNIAQLGAPLNASPVVETRFTDTPPYGSYRYAVTAVSAEGPPLIQSAPTNTILVEFRDRVPPPVPTSVVPLLEGTAVRLLWDPVQAGDLAGYIVYRVSGAGPRTRLTPEPVSETNFRDPAPPPGGTYTYQVSAIDSNGNESETASSAAVFIPR
jgi:hypothetical protein